MYKYKRVVHRTDFEILRRYMNHFEIAIMNDDSEFCFKDSYTFDELNIKVEFSYNPYRCNDTRIVIVERTEELPEFDKTLFLGGWNEKDYGDIKEDQNRYNATVDYLIAYFENQIYLLKGE